MANCSALISSGIVTLSDGVGLDQIILANNVSNVIVENTRMTNASSGPGLYVNQSSNFTINEDIISDSVYGDRIDGSSYGQVRNTEIYNITGSSIQGLELINSNHIDLDTISAHNNDANGIYLSSSDNNSLTNVQAYNNAQNGIYMVNTSDNNSLSGIVASGNTNYGIFIQSSSDHNSFTNVQAYGSVVGLQSDGSMYNIYNNISTYNNAYGTYLSYTS
ncbi:MAG: right-handed parallel beta-helix repeat-containing protein [bacterium]